MSTQAIGTNSGRRDKLFAAEIYRFVRKFQNVEIRVTPVNVEESIYTYVHPPYMCQSVTLIDNDKQFKQLKERHRVRLLRVKEARETADEALKSFLDRQFYDEEEREKLIACGRGKLTEIKALLQAAVDEGVVYISGYNRYQDNYDLRRWLKRYGVGIDCSGFAQQILQHLVEVSRAEVGEIPNKESKLDEYFMRCGWVHKNIRGNGKYGEGIFLKVSTPARARPGDVVVSQSHMRIVANVKDMGDGGIVFELAESTSAIDIPLGQTREDTDIGPRIIHVKYPHQNEPIMKQTPLKKRLMDDAFEENKAENAYVIGRYWETEQLWSNT